MRIVHIITRLILGGAQENTLLSCEDQQRDYGDDVTLVTGPALGPEGSLMERARASLRDVRVIDSLRRSISPRQDWQAWKETVRLLRELRPDIVHTHSAKGGILGRAAAKKLKIPVVHTIHGPTFHPYQNALTWRMYRAAEAWAGRRTDRFISVCDAMTDQYVAAGIAPRERFTTIYSGMDVEPFLNPPRPREDVRRELGFGPHDVVVGKVARLFHLKGHADVIAAARLLAAEIPHLKFLFIGDGLLRDALVREIEDAGLTNCFVFTGLVPPERVPELLAATDIVVHASLREGLARVLPQGLISGKPVVTYDVDGAREVALPGQTGFLLPPRSISDLAAALKTLALDPAVCRQYGETGRRLFTEQFRHQTMTRRIREVYAEVLARR